MLIEMSHDICTLYMFQKFAEYIGQGNWMIIASKIPVTLFKHGQMFASFDCSESCENTGPSTDANS